MTTLTFDPGTRHELKIFGLLAAVFAAVYFLPVGTPRFDGAVSEALELTKWYAREHVVLCLLPAFWIAGAIAAFVSQASVMRFLGPTAPKPLAYGVGSVSGTILAVCSCTVLPLFSGIYRMGAGLGPATAFLYSGPAINVLAIVMTAKVLGAQLGLARAVGRSGVQRRHRLAHGVDLPPRGTEKSRRGRCVARAGGGSAAVADGRLLRRAGRHPGLCQLGRGVTDHGLLRGGLLGQVVDHLALGVVLAAMLWRWFKLEPTRIAAVAVATVITAFALPGHPTWPFLVAVLGLAWLTAGRDDEAGEWFNQAWDYTKQIVPLLLGGVLVAGFLLGRPGHEGMIPSEWISGLVGGNSIASNLFAAVSGAFMYFATLTEVPIVQGLVGSGMGAGPSLALLLAGPALSLPAMLVLNSIVGLKKTVTYISLVVVMATITGWGYGLLVN